MAHDSDREMISSFRAPSTELEPGDVVIIGAGLAGLFTALKLAPLPVTVIAAAPLGEGASSVWAQGGIAAAVGAGDTTAAHAADTIAAGAGLVDEEVARLVAAEAPPGSATCSPTAFPSTAISTVISCCRGRRRIRATASSASRATAPAPPSCRRSSPRSAPPRRSACSRTTRPRT